MTGVKKLRGGKRYYKGLRERASTFGWIWIQGARTTCLLRCS